MMQRTGLAIVLIAALLAGCNRSADTSTASVDGREPAAVAPAPASSSADAKAAPTEKGAAVVKAEEKTPAPVPMVVNKPVATSEPEKATEPAPLPPLLPAAPSSWQPKETTKTETPAPGPGLLGVPAAKPSDSPKPAIPLLEGGQPKATTPSVPAAGSKPSLSAKPLKPEVSVVTSKSGTPALQVKYRWSGVVRPSIQLVLVTDPKADVDALKPMKFNGPDVDRLFRESIAKLNKPVSEGNVLKTVVELVEHDTKEVLRINARDNALKKASAFGVDQGKALALVFYQLDEWADADGAFRMALEDLAPRGLLDPENKYVQAGRIRVWFLSEEKVAWAETVDWPGAPPAPGKKDDTKPAEKKPDEKKPVEDKKPPETTGPDATTPEKPAPGGTTQPDTSGKKQVPVKSTEQPESTSPPKKPAPAETPPAEKPAPAPKAPAAMSIEELSQHIEQEWGKQMQPRTRKLWANGWANYFQVDNVPSVRREVFMAILKEMYNEPEPEAMRKAFALLYAKIKELDNQAKQQR